MHLNQFGQIIQKEWENTPNIRKEIILDEFIIMPDHIHGIIKINNNSTGVWQYATEYAPTFFKSTSKTLGAFIRGFKGTTTKQINLIRNTPNFPLWQRNYYERIIRNENALNNIRNYIKNNPKNWGK